MVAARPEFVKTSLTNYSLRAIFLLRMTAKDTFTVSEAASILRVSRQAVWDAIQRKALDAKKTSGIWQIEGQALAGYAARTQGPQQMQTVMDSMQEMSEATDDTLLRWLLLGLGLYLLFRKK